MNIYGQYRKYTRVRDAAWQALIDCKISEMPVSLSKICGDSGIKLLKNSITHKLVEGEYGVSIKQNNVWYIVFDDYDTIQRIRFTVAHEIGHIFLGHEMRYGYYTRRDNIVKPAAEKEADMFAARLLAPACVLWGINALTAQQIADVCNISLSAASYRAERIDLLRERGKFLTSPLEQIVYKQFENYIRNNRLN